MDEAQIEALYHTVRALSTRLFISPFTREDLSLALHSGHYESLLAQLLSCLVCVAERGDDWERAYEPGFSDVARPCVSQADFPPVVVVGYRAVKRLKKILDEKRFKCLESLARTDDRRKAPRTLLYDWRDKVAGVFSEDNGLASGKVDFWDLRPESKLRFLQELLDAAISTARVREYLEMKVGGTHAFNEPGEDGSMERCVLCDLGGDLVCCDKCPRVFHSRCLNVSRRQLGTKDEDWVCPECKAEWKVDFDQPRLEVLGRGAEGEVFWLGDQCLMEGLESAADGNLKIHRGEGMPEAWARIKEFTQNQALLDKAEKLVAGAHTAGRNPSSSNYINNYVDSHDPAAQTSLDRYLRRARQIAKKENAVRPNGMPARFRYRNGDGPEGFCKTYLLCMEKALAGLLTDSFWRTSGTWIDEVKRSRFPGECGRLLVELIQNLKDGMPLLDWANIEERPVGHQNRRDDEHLAEAYKPRKQPWWEYYRGRAAQDECLNRLPRNEVLRLARRGGLVEVEGVAYRLFQHVQKPVVAMRLQVLSMLEGCRSWSVLAEAVLLVDAVVTFDKFEADKNSSWVGASITNKATPESGSTNSAATKYDVIGMPGSPEAQVQLSVGDIPVWLVKRFEDQRRQEFDETLGRTLEKPASLQEDPKECCGICGMKEPMWVRDSTQAVVDWICCDKCEQWYHQDCLLGSDQSVESKNDGSWLCARCKEVKGRTKRTKRSQSGHQTPHSKQRKSLTVASGYPQPIPFLSPVVVPGGMPNSRRRGWGVDPHFTDVFRKKRSPRVRKDGWGSTVEYALGIRPDSAEWKGVLEKGPPPPIVFHTPPPQPVVYSPVPARDPPRSANPVRKGRRLSGTQGRWGGGPKMAGGGGSTRRGSRGRVRSQVGGLPDGETLLDPDRLLGGGLPEEEDPESGIREVGGVRRKYRRVACGWIERILPQGEPAGQLSAGAKGSHPLGGRDQDAAVGFAEKVERGHPLENGNEGTAPGVVSGFSDSGGADGMEGEKDEVPDSAEEEEEERGQRVLFSHQQPAAPFGIGAACHSRSAAMGENGRGSVCGMTTRSRIRSQGGAVPFVKPDGATLATPCYTTGINSVPNRTSTQGDPRSSLNDVQTTGTLKMDDEQPGPSSINRPNREVNPKASEGAQPPSLTRHSTLTRKQQQQHHITENGTDSVLQGDTIRLSHPASPGEQRSSKCSAQTLRMTLRKRPRACEDNGHPPDNAMVAKVDSVSDEEEVPRAKRLARAAGWRKTAECALERAQMCQQWVITTRSLKKKNGLAAIQSCLSSFLKPEDVVNRVQEVVAGWALSSAKQTELLGVLRKQWQSRGLNWPAKWLRDEPNGDIVQGKGKKRIR